MFNIDDLWRIISFLKDGTTSRKLSELTSTLASSEKQTASNFFENTLDQIVFSSNDYRKFRTFLIDWYAAHRTLSTTQRNATDVHAIPNDHLSELFRSFGFPIGLNLVPLTTKANFFLDLVNFYKKKGTPEALTDVLDYYGFSDADLVEYWLVKNSNGDFVFRGESVRTAATGSTILLQSDVAFETMTSNDPHWMLKEADIPALVAANKINLPSKTPYFSLTSIFSLDRLVSIISIVSRVVQDQYWNRYYQGLSLPQDVPVKNVGEIVSLLEVYLATIYTFEKMFGYGTITSYENFWCYDGDVSYTTDNPPAAYDLDKIKSLYEDAITRPTSRADRDSRIATLVDQWSRPIDSTSYTPVNFLKDQNSAEGLLNSINPNLKGVCDTWFNSGDESYLITYLIGSLDNWIRINIDSKSPSLVITQLGLNFRDEVDDIVKFFTPYRARLAFVDTAYEFRNPLTESIPIDEYNHYITNQTHNDDILRDAQATDSTTDIDIDFLESKYSQTHIDDVGMGNYLYERPDFDEGGVFDEGANYDDRWREEVIHAVVENPQDSIPITGQVDQLIIDNFYNDYPRGIGDEGILGFDVNFEFDEQYRTPIVTDYFVVAPWPPIPEEVLEYGTTPDPIRGFNSGPVIMDMGNDYDQEIPAPVVEDRIEIIVRTF